MRFEGIPEREMFLMFTPASHMPQLGPPYGEGVQVTVGGDDQPVSCTFCGVLEDWQVIV
jgi:hypothetical protein